MNWKRRRIIFPAALLAAALIAACLTPLVVAGTVRGWLWWFARHEHVSVQLGEIEAPLLRPIVLHQLHFRSEDAGSSVSDVQIDRAELRLNFPAIIGHSDARRIRDLMIDGARIRVRRKTGAELKTTDSDWRAFKDLFADSFRISHLDLRVESGDTIVDGHDISLAASEIETGSVTVGEIVLASPLVSKRFTNLRGATAWQNQRLTLGAITLTRGIDIDAVTADFGHLALERIGFEFNADVFGGKVRANVTSESRGHHPVWDLAGTATGISLRQMAETLAWRAPAAGAVRTCKFTFRGDTAELMRSTASVWLELNDLNWAGRKADTIMFGASVYNRRLHLEQLYVKQDENQLTMSGDSPLTLRAEDWTKPGLNADISANIPDVTVNWHAYSALGLTNTQGQLAIEGTLGVEDRKRRATLTATGHVQLNSARVFGDARLTGQLTCDRGNAVIENGELLRGDSAIAARGEIDFSDLGDLHARFFPAQPVLDLTALPSGSCVSGLSFAVASGESSTENVSEIEIRGGLLARDWMISLFDGSPNAPEQRVARTFQLCSPLNSAGPVRLTAAGAGAR